jgi:hypothetical protein
MTERLRDQWAQAAVAHNAARLHEFLATGAVDALRGMTWPEFQAAAELLIERGKRAQELLVLAQTSGQRDESPTETFWRAARRQR